MNRADLMQHALRFGDWRSRHDIFNDAGQFFLTNNAASELRARGFTVEQRRKNGQFQYRIENSVAGELDGERRPLGVSTATENLAQSLPLSGSASDPSGADRTRTLPQGTTVALAHAPAPLGTPLQLELTVAA